MRTENEAEQGGKDSDGDENTRVEDANHAQLALLEVWRGLPGYGLVKGRSAGEEAGAALTKLRKALNVGGDPAALSSEGGSAEEGTEPVAPDSTLQVLETEWLSPTGGEISTW